MYIQILYSNQCLFQPAAAVDCDKKKKFCPPSIIIIKHAKEIHALLQETATAICVKVKGSKGVSG